MKPEEIDKLFKERLGGSSPTPPADLWNRLQDRIETEMPAASTGESKPGGFMWLSYSIAATITLLLSVGVVFYSVQTGTVPVERDGMASHNGLKPEEPLVIPAPSTANKQLAQVTEPAASSSAEVESTEPAIPAASEPAQVETVAKNTIAKASTKAPAKSGGTKSSTKSTASNTQFVAQTKQPAIPENTPQPELHNTRETTPVVFASNAVDMNAQPVEIIIKRAVAVQQVEPNEELSGFEKKQKLAKNIIKQVRNLSNGERVELSELGINADKIALETQIGKQKISKVINL